MQSPTKDHSLPVKIRLRCNSCNHIFKRHRIEKLCPHCGAASVIEDDLQAAEDLLKELEEAGH